MKKLVIQKFASPRDFWPKKDRLKSSQRGSSKMSVCDSNTSVAGSFVSQRARLIRNSAELSDSDSSDAEDPENGDCPQSTQNNSESDSKVDLDKDCNGGNGNNKTVDLESDKDEDNRSAIKNDGHDEAKRQLHYFRAHVQQLESKLTLLRVREDYKTNYLDEICTLKTALMEKDDQIKALSMELKESKQRAKQTKEKEAGSACKRRDCLVDKEELFYHRKEMQNALDKMKQGQPGKMIDLRNVIRLQRAQLEIDNLKASNAKLKEDYDTMEDKLCSLGAECKQAVSNVKADCDVKIKWLMEENAKLQACLNTETKIMERFDVNNNRKGKMSLQHCVAESKKLVAENSDLQNEIVLVKSDLELAKFDLKKAREEVATYENLARKLKNQLGAIEKEAESAKAKFESQQKALVTSRRNESNFKRELNRALQVSRSCANCARLSFELNQCQIMCNNMAYSHSFVSGNYHEIGRQLNAARGEICAQQWELQDLRSKTRELNGSLEWGKKHHESIVKDLQVVLLRLY